MHAQPMSKIMRSAFRKALTKAGRSVADIERLTQLPVKDADANVLQSKKLQGAACRAARAAGVPARKQALPARRDPLHTRDGRLRENRMSLRRS